VNLVRPSTTRASKPDDLLPESVGPFPTTTRISTEIDIDPEGVG
jgi:hypothetical protein